MESEESKEETQFSSTINFRFNFNVLIDRSKCHAPSVAHMCLYGKSVRDETVERFRKESELSLVSRLYD